jgi:hypothetical protein
VKRCSKNKIAHKDNNISTAVAYAAWRLSSSSMDPSSLQVRCPTQNLYFISTFQRGNTSSILSPSLVEFKWALTICVIINVGKILVFGKCICLVISFNNLSIS